MVRLSQIN